MRGIRRTRFRRIAGELLNILSARNDDKRTTATVVAFKTLRRDKWVIYSRQIVVGHKLGICSVSRVGGDGWGEEREGPSK